MVCVCNSFVGWVWGVIEVVCVWSGVRGGGVYVSGVVQVVCGCVSVWVVVCVCM